MTLCVCNFCTALVLLRFEKVWITNVRKPRSAFWFTAFPSPVGVLLRSPTHCQTFKRHTNRHTHTHSHLRISRFIKASRPLSVREKVLVFFCSSPRQTWVCMSVWACRGDDHTRHTDICIGDHIYLIGIAVEVRIITSNQKWWYRPLPVHVSAFTNTFVALWKHRTERWTA